MSMEKGVLSIPYYYYSTELNTIDFNACRRQTRKLYFFFGSHGNEIIKNHKYVRENIELP